MDFKIEYNKDAFIIFVRDVMRKHSIHNVDEKDVCDFIMEAITAEVNKNKGSSRQFTFGIDDGRLEQAICKSIGYIDDWKKSKKEKKKDEKKEEPKEEKKTSKKEKKESEFDITQLELF